MARRKNITVEDAEKQIARWNEIRSILLRIGEVPEDDLATRVVKKYLKLGNVREVVDELHEEGFRAISKATGKPCKFDSNAVSETIREKVIEDSSMQTLAQEILADHTAFINRIFN